MYVAFGWGRVKYQYLPPSRVELTPAVTKSSLARPHRPNTVKSNWPVGPKAKRHISRHVDVGLNLISGRSATEGVLRQDRVMEINENVANRAIQVAHPPNYLNKYKKKSELHIQRTHSTKAQKRDFLINRFFLKSL